MRRRNSEGTTNTALPQNNMLLPVHLRILLAFTLLLIALNSSVHNVSGDHAEIVPRVVTFKVANPLTKPLEYRFAGKEPRSETQIDIIGNGQEWTFVQFDKLPANSSLRVNGQPKGYNDSEEIQPENWYWFKDKLPLVLVINSSAQPPITVSFAAGSPSENDKKQANSMGPDEMREFTNKHGFNKDALTQSLILTWEGAGGSNPVSINPSKVSFEVPEDGRPPLQRITLSGDPKLWTFVRLKEMNRRIELIAKPSVPENLAAVRGTTLMVDEWIGYKNSVAIDVSLLANQPDSGSAVITLETAIAQSPEQTKEAVTQDIKAKKIVSNGNLQLTVDWKPAVSDSLPYLRIFIWIVAVIVVGVIGVALWWLLSGLLQEQKTKRQAKKSQKERERREQQDNVEPRQPSPVSEPEATIGMDVPSRVTGTAQSKRAVEGGAVPKSSDPVMPASVGLRHTSDSIAALQNSVNDLENDLKKLGIALEKKADRTSDVLVTQADLSQKLSGLQIQMKQDAKAELDTRLGAVLDKMEGLTKRVETIHQDIGQNFEALKLNDDIVKDSVNTTLQIIGESEDRQKSQLDQLKEMLIQQAFPESFFARTLGMILSKNVDASRDGNIEHLIGECLNHFFQAEVPRADSLHELRARAEGVVTALKRVVAQITIMKPAVVDKTRLHMRRAEELLAEIGGLQTQLQTRKLSINTTLRFPVSAYPGARQTFLDELGRGIRSAIDKLDDPQNFFEGDLERLVTADLVAIVDICDKEVSPPPGSPSVLETALKQLFEQAGLREIIPHVGQPFGTADQDLVEMVQGAPGTNMTVAAVITRGFYFTHRDNETMLRKAGVKVYR